MSSVDVKECYKPCSKSYNTNKKAANGRKAFTSRCKPTPSKWDDAQKWLVSLSVGGDHGHHANAKPRNSNADDRRLLPPSPQNGRDSCSSVEDKLANDLALAIPFSGQDDAETKKIDCGEAMWRTGKPVEESPVPVRSVCLRDMGTEMTPIASKEPSRSGTPLRSRSPITSKAASPKTCANSLERTSRAEAESGGCSIIVENNGDGSCRKYSALESRASAWDEAERTKYLARYKREEVNIQAWENHLTRKAETEMKRAEVKAERLKSRAREKLASKVASTRRVAEEKRSSAEARLNERAARTSEKADYIRRTGHLPSSFFSLKLPSMCR